MTMGYRIGVGAAAMIAVLAGAANAGTMTLGGAQATAAATATALRQDFLNAGGNASAAWATSGVTGFSIAPKEMYFADTGTTGAVSAAAGNFFLGTRTGLGDVHSGEWFNNLGAGVTVAGTDVVLAFGNNHAQHTAKSVTITLDPGVTGFAFNYADVGDVVSGVSLDVLWSDGTSHAGIQGNGYVSLVAAAGQTITSVTLTQNPEGNDGFLFHGFSTLTVVPLPPAAWAGLAMLGGVAGVRKLRRR